MTGDRNASLLAAADALMNEHLDEFADDDGYEVGWRDSRYGVTVRDAIYDALASSSASGAERPKVKALRWEPGPAYSETWVAETGWGDYSVWEISGSAYWSNLGRPGVFAGATLDAAKAAAQADYEARILSALDEPEPASAPVWRPIETAPKDRTPVIVLERFENGLVFYDVAYFSEWNGDEYQPGWYAVADDEPSCSPTHWMPLPPPPQTGGADA